MEKLLSIVWLWWWHSDIHIEKCITRRDIYLLPGSNCRYTYTYIGWLLKNVRIYIFFLFKLWIKIENMHMYKDKEGRVHIWKKPGNLIVGCQWKLLTTLLHTFGSLMHYLKPPYTFRSLLHCFIVPLLVVPFSLLSSKKERT